MSGAWMERPRRPVRHPRGRASRVLREGRPRGAGRSERAGEQRGRAVLHARRGSLGQGVGRRRSQQPERHVLHDARGGHRVDDSAEARARGERHRSDCARLPGHGAHRRGAGRCGEHDQRPSPSSGRCRATSPSTRSRPASSAPAERSSTRRSCSRRRGAAPPRSAPAPARRWPRLSSLARTWAAEAASFVTGRDVVHRRRRAPLGGHRLGSSPNARSPLPPKSFDISPAETPPTRAVTQPETPPPNEALAALGDPHMSSRRPPPPQADLLPPWASEYFLGDDPTLLTALVPTCFLSMALYTRNPATNFIFDEQEALLANPYVRAAADLYRQDRLARGLQARLLGAHAGPDHRLVPSASRLGLARALEDRHARLQRVSSRLHQRAFARAQRSAPRPSGPQVDAQPP